jgi:hypothetical protein
VLKIRAHATLAITGREKPGLGEDLKLDYINDNRPR